MKYIYYRNLITPGLESRPIEYILERIQTDPFVARYTNTARAYLNDGKVDKYKEYKITKLPAFIPCAQFKERVSKNTISAMTGLCFVDVDHLDDKTMEDVKLFLDCDSHVFLAYRSLSGRGFHIIVKYNLELPEDMVMPAQWMRDAYAGIQREIAGYYHEACGLGIDVKCNNIERACCIAHDPFALYNPEPETFNFRCALRKVKQDEKGNGK